MSECKDVRERAGTADPGAPLLGPVTEALSVLACLAQSSLAQRWLLEHVAARASQGRYEHAGEPSIEARAT